MTIELEQKDSVQPKCPHCSAQIQRIWFQEIKGVLGKRYVYFCPSCNSTLGVSHRKGFLMG